MRKKLLIPLIIILLAALPVSVFAASQTNDEGITLTYPGGSVACENKITTSGVPEDGYVVYRFFYVLNNTQLFLGGNVNNGGGNLSVQYPIDQTPADASHYGINILAFDSSGNRLGSQIAAKWTCDQPTATPPPPSDEGCTPGYWKNHSQQWPATGYSTSDFFNNVFVVNYFGIDYTLDDGIHQGGGQLRRAARHGVAALLNAAHPDVSYPYTINQVITLVQAGDENSINLLETANELGCPIGR